MKTALTRYIEWVNSNDFRASVDKGEYLAIDRKEKELLSLEREQILNAFVAGDERGTKDIPFNAEQYYSQTYK